MNTVIYECIYSVLFEIEIREDLHSAVPSGQ